MQAGAKLPGPPSTGSLHLPDDLDFDALSLHSREPSPAVMLSSHRGQAQQAPSDPSPWSDAPSPQGKVWEAPFPLVGTLLPDGTKLVLKLLVRRTLDKAVGSSDTTAEAFRVLVGSVTHANWQS